MAKPGFTRNAKVIAGILHNDKDGQAAVDAAAAAALAATNAPEAFLTDPYHTDRYVRGVVVSADSQAKNGTATRAAAAVGLTPG